MREDNAGIMLPERGLRFSLKKNNVDLRYKFKKNCISMIQNFYYLSLLLQILLQNVLLPFWFPEKNKQQK